MIRTLFKVHDIFASGDGYGGDRGGGAVDTGVPLLHHARFLSYKHNIWFHLRPSNFADSFRWRGGDFQLQGAFRRLAHVVDAQQTILAACGEVQSILKRLKRTVY